MIKFTGFLSRKTFRLSSMSFSRLNENSGQITKTSEASIAKTGEAFKYVDGELVPINHLVLHQRDNIEQYIFKIIKDYHRTTYKVGLTLESELITHGLDSLDAIELAMQIEEDLGYKISAENLSVFKKVKHFVTFIEQVENFKKTYNKDPLP